jgi:hypothetical protein
MLIPKSFVFLSLIDQMSTILNNMSIITALRELVGYVCHLFRRYLPQVHSDICVEMMSGFVEDFVTGKNTI